MSQRTHHSESPAGIHVACIMDGNGRWATAQGQPRLAGHRAGVETVSRIVEAAPGFGIGTLPLYAFSSDNWHRPRREVVALFDLLDRYIRKETDRCVRDGVRVTFIGRRDRLSSSIVRAMERMEEDMVRQALQISAGNQTRAARMLAISRDALRYKIKKFNL